MRGEAVVKGETLTHTHLSGRVGVCCGVGCEASTEGAPGGVEAVCPAPFLPSFRLCRDVGFNARGTSSAHGLARVITQRRLSSGMGTAAVLAGGLCVDALLNVKVGGGGAGAMCVGAVCEGEGSPLRTGRGFPERECDPSLSQGCAAVTAPVLPASCVMKNFKHTQRSREQQSQIPHLPGFPTIASRAPPLCPFPLLECFTAGPRHHVILPFCIWYAPPKPRLLLF